MRIQVAKWALNKIHPRVRLPHLPLPLRPAAVTTIDLLNPCSLPQTARRFQTQAATTQEATASPRTIGSTTSADEDVVAEEAVEAAVAVEAVTTREKAKASAETSDATQTGKLTGLFFTAEKKNPANAS